MSTVLTPNLADEHAEIRKILMDARNASEGRATEEQLDASAPLVVYFSSISGNTHKFVEKLHARRLRLPLRTGEETLVLDEPYVLIVPTYGKPEGAGNVPPQVVKFLNVEQNRQNMLGVIGSGNTNFGPLFGIAADIVAKKCNVPVLFHFGRKTALSTRNSRCRPQWQECAREVPGYELPRTERAAESLR